MLYLGAVRNLREGLGQPFRRRLRNAIAKVAADEAPEAAVAHFHLVLLELEGKLLSAFGELETVRRDQIESVATVLAGEPVIKGTRIASHHIADLVKRGTTTAELREDFDLTDGQIRAAVVFDQVTPRRGRPAVRRQRTVHVPVT